MTSSACPPGAYDPDLAAAVCLRLDEGEDLTTVCRRPGMPTRGAVRRWADEVPEFADKLAASRRRCGELMVHDMVDRSEGKGLPPELMPSTPAEQTSRDRIVLTARRMLLSIYDPSRFGLSRPRSRGAQADPERAVRAEKRAIHLAGFLERFAEGVESNVFLAAMRDEMDPEAAAVAKDERGAKAALRTTRAPAARTAPVEQLAPVAPALLAGAAAVEDARVEFRKELVAMSIPPGEIDGLMVEAEDKGLFDPRNLHEKYREIYGPPESMAPPPPARPVSNRQAKLIARRDARDARACPPPDPSPPRFANPGGP